MKRKTRYAAMGVNLILVSAAMLQAKETDVSATLHTIESEDKAAAKVAEQNLMRAVHRAIGTDTQAKIVEQLNEAVLNDDRQLATRRLCCEALGFIGGDASIGALYKAMNQRELQDDARRAIERIPGSRATRVLAAGLQIGEPPFKIALLNSLGRRGDETAVSAIIGYVHNDDDAVAQAALHALANIPVPESTKTVREAFEDKRKGATDALLKLAYRYLDEQDSIAALELLLELLGDESLTISQRARWITAMGRAGGEIAMGQVMRALDEADSHLYSAALEACIHLPGVESTLTIARKMHAVEGKRRHDLLNVLAQRGDSMDQEISSMIRTVVEKGTAEDRVAAIRTVEAAQVDVALGVLIKTLDEEPGPVRDAAIHALYHMPGEFATKQIIYALRGKPGDKRELLTNILRHRAGDDAVAELKKADK